MNYINRITRYFKQSLIDAERLCPADKDLLPVLGPKKLQTPSASYIALNKSIWLAGRIDADLARDIIASKQVKDKPKLMEVELVLFPRVDLFGYQGGEMDKRKHRVLLPLIIFVRLQEDGELKPSSKAPWIPREWLGPNQSVDEPIGEVVVLDKFLTQNPFDGIETWQQLVAYSTDMLCFTTGMPQVKANRENVQQDLSLFDIEVHSEYKLSNQCLLQTDTLVFGAKAKILKALDALLETEILPPLYECFCSNSSARIETNQDLQYDSIQTKKHLGQMTGEFHLSPKQRNALHHFLKQENGEILAVNGPPGTGKTTLLRSVVANLWTQAALDDKDPPLIVATSNNNQAVTNILESFAKVDEEGIDGCLQGRWLPEVDSYGLYCCASGKANAENPHRYLGPRGEGCMEVWQTQDYLNRASNYFKNKASQWHGKPFTNIGQAKKVLHKTLRKIREVMIEGIEYRASFQLQKEKIIASHCSIEALIQEVAIKGQLCSTLEGEYNQVKFRLDTIYALWEKRNFWVRLLLWLPPIRKQEQRKTARLLNSMDLHLNSHDDSKVESWLTEQLRQKKAEIEQAQQHIEDLTSTKESYESVKTRLTDWIEQHKPEKLFEETWADQVDEINDRVLRFVLFKLATHYWEARWLEEMEVFLKDFDPHERSPVTALRKLRRFAKLTPCFVSTFYMIPSTFSAWRGHDIPLFSEIDLLIVDEAGQALPEVSAVSFAFAKRALIVGDIHQIEPVWGVPVSVDRANLKLFGLFHDEQQYDTFWLKSGLLASGGNLMRVAQRQCRYHQLSELQRGLYLTEHRRCFDSIISYCNTLVYKGVLEALRGEPESEVPWGTMSMISVLTASKSYGGSRGNPGEAGQISLWLQQEKAQIIHYARESNPKWVDRDDAEVLRLAVGIITPFSKQAALIRAELKENGIDGLTVGTVHSLQGDERIVIIFSSVYGENDRDMGKFYDIGPNMLNVAVSRAKDAFVVFGHPDVFGANNSSSPSGVLRSYLLRIDNTFSC